MPSMSSKIEDKLLIIAPAWIGDMIISQALYLTLKKQRPNIEIDILAPKSTLGLATRMPQINHCIEQPLQHGELKLHSRYQQARSLRTKHYSQAIILPNSFKSALIPWWAHIKKRTGWLGEQRYLLLNDIRKLDKQQYISLQERYIALGLPNRTNLPDNLAKPELKISADNLNDCLIKLNLTKDQRPIVALCPGAAYGSAKRWPIQHFIEIATHFLQKNHQVWLFGSTKEQELANNIQAATAHACFNLTGKTSLLDVVDLLSIAEVAICNDSGLMHIAAAVNIPVIALYGSSSPHYTPPLTAKASILQLDYDCIPCFKRECPLIGKQHLRCLTHLTPEMVITASEKLLT